MLASRIHQFFGMESNNSFHTAESSFLESESSLHKYSRMRYDLVFINNFSIRFQWFNRFLANAFQDFQTSCSCWSDKNQFEKIFDLATFSPVIYKSFISKYLVQLLVSRSHILNHFKFGEWAWKKKQLKLIDWFDFFVLFLNFSSFLNDLNLIRSVVYLVNSSSIIELGLIQIDVHIWEGKQKKITCY